MYTAEMVMMIVTNLSKKTTKQEEEVEDEQKLHLCKNTNLTVIYISTHLYNGY